MTTREEIVDCWHENGRNAAEVGRLLGMSSYVVREELKRAGFLDNRFPDSGTIKTGTNAKTEDPLADKLRKFHAERYTP